MCRNTAEYKGRKTADFTKMTMQRIFGCAILNIRETVSQVTQSSQDRRDELDVRLAVPSAQSARGMEIGMKILLINGSPKGDRSNTLLRLEAGQMRAALRIVDVIAESQHIFVELVDILKCTLDRDSVAFALK